MGHTTIRLFQVLQTEIILALLIGCPTGWAQVTSTWVDNANGQMFDLGNSDVTFYDDVINNGELQTSAGTTAVVLGDASGAGAYTGTGTVFFAGTLAPGNSPAEIDFGGDMTLTSTSTLEIELGGTMPGTEYDKINVAGVATLGGTLEVLLIDLGNGQFTPNAGDTFEILTAAGGVTGTFASEILPTLSNDLLWFLNYSATAVELVATFGADFEEDGDVDRFDLDNWEANFGSTSATHMQGDANADTTVNGSDFLTWQRQFGMGISSPSLAQSVPEPSSALLLAGMVGGGMMLRRPERSSSRSRARS